MSILDVLKDKKVIKEDDVAKIEAESVSSGLSLEQVLISRGVTPEQILSSKGEAMDIPTKSLKDLDIPGKVFEYIPAESAEHYHFVPIGVTDGVLEVGIVDADDMEARDALNFISSRVGMPYKLFLITEEDFSHALEMYKGISGEVTKALTELETELSEKISEQKGEEVESEGNKLEPKIVEDAPVTKIVATILSYASDGNASDIHIEPMHDNIRVRFRVDGILNTSLTLPSKVHSALVA